MLPGSTSTNPQPVTIRGLYGYRIEGVWWEQSHAIIHRGRRKIDEHPLLIKLLKGSNGGASNWLQRDYQIAQGLASDRVIKPFALEQTELGPALIYADEGARPLEELAAKSPLDVETILTIGASIAETVAALHEERFAHCSLNPSTIWLDANGERALISDFSCARCLNDRSGDKPLPPSDEWIDVRYMSPEQTGRLQISIDQRTDIYALGIILFRLLTGKVPFDGEDPMQIIDGHVAKQPTLPAELPDAPPAGLFKVISKALAKSPALRYQTANGLVADLLDCRTLFRSTGTLDDFEPGRHDAKAVLRVSKRLYGRDQQIAALSKKVTSVRQGRQALLLVSGAPGVGKSALLGELEAFVQKENGRFASGKFDQYKRNVPFLALIEAFEQLIGQLLSETKDQFELWRSHILTAVGNNARVVIDVIPELERITGPQPPVPSLPPVQARNRFRHVFVKLIQAFAPKDQLLCIVMDDLQWVDTASRELLTDVLTDPDTTNILFAGAYRDNEVDPAHSLNATIGALETSHIDVQTLNLNGLIEPDVLQLVQDTFTVSSVKAAGLAQVLSRKTGGDPLYLIQFLHLLCDEGLIAFDFHKATWAWDLPSIQQQAVTQDVLDLLNQRLAGLQEGTRKLLATAACIGVSFEPNKLAIAAARPLSEVLQCMRVGVDEGLIIALDDSAQRFRFLHDRVQQASFDCIPDQEKKAFRLHIGRRLMAEDESVPAPEVLSNLNYAWELISDVEERLRVARLNLVAGQRARQALAYQNALGYLSIGLALAGREGWRCCYDVAFELHYEAFKCEYLTGDFERADELFRVLITNARSKLDKAKTYRTKVLLDTSEERYADAIDAAIEALRLFNIRYVRRASRLHLLIQLILVRLRLRGRKPQDLVKEADLNDAEKLAALRLLDTLFPTTYQFSPMLFAFNGLKIVNYSLRHGMSPNSAGGFAALGFVMKGGYEFGRFALELAERSKDPSIICPVLFGTTAMIYPRRHPIDEVFPLFDRLRKLALEAGENQYVILSIMCTIAARIGRGSRISDVLRECEEHGPFLLASKDVLAVEGLRLGESFVFALQGKTVAPYSLSDSVYDEEAAEIRYREGGTNTLLALQYVFRTFLACMYCRYEDALILSEKADAVTGFIKGFLQLADHHLYRGLAAAAALTDLNLKARKHRKVLRHCLARLHRFANKCPHNYLQHEMLLKAEAARVENNFADALRHYNRAIELAEAEGYMHLVGLGNERAALFCLANEERRLALWYITAARQAYDKWGASAKTAWLDREYSGLLRAAAGISDEATSPPPTFISHGGEKFDISAALQASQLLTTSHEPDRVLPALMEVIRLQAGAETAQLLVLEGGKLRLEASAAANSGDVLLFPTSSPNKDPASFSPGIVNYVLHSGEDIVLHEADKDPRCARCSYVANRRPKSVICTGIRHKGELLGVIYLEHTQIVGAFSGQKLEWLRLLSTELGLTVWSGRLSRYRDYMQKFAPAAVANEIDANPTSPDLTAKDCDVSILFADVAGYTRITERMGRRQLRELMNRAFSRFVDEVHRYEGVLLEISGDELFVVFGDQNPAQHVRKAANAALAISGASSELKEELGSAETPLLMNMGINSGIASVGLHSVEASSGSRYRYGASGTVVNIAARVRGLARNGDILISADSVARVATEFVFENMGEHSLKNVGRPVGIHRLVGPLKAHHPICGIERA